PLSCFDSLGTGAILAYWIRYPAEFAWLTKNSRPLFMVLAWICGTMGLTFLWVRGYESRWVISLGHTFVVFFFGWAVYRCAVGSTGIFRPLLEYPLLIF